MVEETVALRDYDLRVNSILVEKQFEDRVPPVLADAHQLEQVFLNILNNAVDAMLEPGEEGIAPGKPRGGRLAIHIFTDGTYAVVQFHDSGPGIKDPKRIFDPFYTTKKIGKGTGSRTFHLLRHCEGAQRRDHGRQPSGGRRRLRREAADCTGGPGHAGGGNAGAGRG